MCWPAAWSWLDDYPDFSWQFKPALLILMLFDGRITYHPHGFSKSSVNETPGPTLFLF